MDSEKRQRIIIRTTLVGSVVNLVLVAFKLLAGFLGRSSAMIADGIHSLTDLVSDFMVLIFVKLSSKPQDETHDYGHGKFETLASASVGLLLLAVGIGLLYDGVIRTIGFFNGESIAQPGMIALWAALISILAKEALYHYTIYKERGLNSPAMVANAWHHRSDALTSVATLIGIGGAILLGSKWAVLDPITAAFVSIFIIKAACKPLKGSFDQLLERSLPEEQKREIEQIVLSTPDVCGMHRLRTRPLGNCIAIEMHIKLRGDMTLVEAHDVASAVESRLREHFGPNTHISVHMEPEKK